MHLFNTILFKLIFILLSNEIYCQEKDFLDDEKTQNVDYFDDVKISTTDNIFTIDNRIRKANETFEIKANNSVMEEPIIDSEGKICVGIREYCNQTREVYVEMILNYIYPQPYEWVLIATHSLVFIIGLVGNALVCVAVYRNHTMRTVTNFFIVNLAVADFLVILLCLPPTVLWDVTETWFFGEALCKLLLYFQSVSVTVSVLTLSFISVDRWYAICFPLKSKSTTGRAKTAILIIWIISLIFNVPDLIVLTTQTITPLRYDLQYLIQCGPTWSERNDLVWHVVKMLIIYTIPLMLMTIVYCQIAWVLYSKKIPGQAETTRPASAEINQQRARRKAAKMLVAVVVMFAVCYFPVHLLSVLRYTMSIKQSDFITCLALVSHVLCYANSAMNPLIYNFMSDTFRREFQRSFCCLPRAAPEPATSLTRLSSQRQHTHKHTYAKFTLANGNRSSVLA